MQPAAAPREAHNPNDKALKIRLKALGPEHADVAATYSNIAGNHMRQYTGKLGNRQAESRFLRPAKQQQKRAVKGTKRPV